MKLARTYVFDAFANLLGQGILILVGFFACTSAAGLAVWALAAAGFGVFLSVMERGAESRRGASFGRYFMFVLLPALVVALISGSACGIYEFIRWSSGYSAVVMIISPLYPLFIPAGSAWVTLTFLAFNRLTRTKA